MEPYQYLEKVARELASMQDREQINRVLDEVEFLFDALDPSLQELAETLLEKIQQRLREVP